MKNSIFITKKTHNSFPPKIGTDFIELNFEGDIKDFLELNRKKIILLKDSLLNRENLNKDLQKIRLEMIKNSIENNLPLSQDMIIPNGIYKNSEHKQYKDNYMERTLNFIEELNTTKEINKDFLNNPEIFESILKEDKKITEKTKKNDKIIQKKTKQYIKE